MFYLTGNTYLPRLLLKIQTLLNSQRVFEYWYHNLRYSFSNENYIISIVKSEKCVESTFSIFQQTLDSSGENNFKKN